jgi:hypothetical protein
VGVRVAVFMILSAVLANGFTPYSERLKVTPTCQRVISPLAY